jgi:hypothetical protein
MVYQSLRKRRPEGFLLCDGTLEVSLNPSGLVSHFARIANLIDNAGWIAVVGFVTPAKPGVEASGFPPARE